MNRLLVIWAGPSSIAKLEALFSFNTEQGQICCSVQQICSVQRMLSSEAAILTA